MGAFIELQSGEEILLDLSDIPEPPQYLFANNPYLKDDIRFKRWRSAAKARYTKSCYRAIKIARDKADFIDLVGDAKAVLQDPYAWENYLHERDLDHPKRSVGRPSLPPEQRRKPMVKRSDEMRKMLTDHGVEIKADSSIEGFNDFEFMKNGRIKFLGDEDAGIEPYSLSVHQFMQDYL